MRISAMRSVCVLLVSCLLQSGCADKPAEAARAAFERAQAALRSGDYGALYDLMSKDAQVEVAVEVKRQAEAAAGMGALAATVLGFDPAEVASLPARAAYVKVMGGVHEARVGLDSGVGGAGAKQAGLAAAKVVKCKAKGGKATVTVELPGAPGAAGGAKLEVLLVLEGDAWRFASPPPVAAPPDKRAAGARDLEQGGDRAPAGTEPDAPAGKASD